jgi:hypothetical protein
MQNANCKLQIAFRFWTNGELGKNRGFRGWARMTASDRIADYEPRNNPRHPLFQICALLIAAKQFPVQSAN